MTTYLFPVKRENACDPIVLYPYKFYISIHTHYGPLNENCFTVLINACSWKLWDACSQPHVRLPLEYYSSSQTNHPCRTESGSLVPSVLGWEGSWDCRRKVVGHSQCCTTNHKQNIVDWKWFHLDRGKQMIHLLDCTCRRTEIKKNSNIDFHFYHL